MDLNETLKTTKIFKELDETELEAVSSGITVKEHPADSIIIREGSATQTLYVLKEGSVSIEIPMENDYLQLAILGPGDFFGEMGLILGNPHSASVRAIEDTVTLQMDRHDLDVILTWNTLLASKIWKAFADVLASRVLATNAKLKQFFQNCQTQLSESDSKNLEEISKGIFK